MAKYLDFDGLSRVVSNIEALIPTKTSDLTNDSITGMNSYTGWTSATRSANDAPYGFVWCRVGSSYTTDLPVSSGYGGLLTFGSSSTGCQIFIARGSSNTATPAGAYVRLKISNTWTPWLQLANA